MAKPVVPVAAMKAYKPMELTLPETPSEIVTNILEFTYFIYGDIKIGKTSFSAQFDNALHMMFEPGGKRQKIKQVFPLNWKEVEEYVRLVEARTDYCNTVVVDTVDLMWDMASKFVCEQKGVDYLKDIGFGDGYNITGSLIREALVRLQRGRGLVILSHEKTSPIIEGSSIMYTKASCISTCEKVLGKWCDLTGRYMLLPTGERVLQIAPSNIMAAGHRIEGAFQYMEGYPIQQIPMGKNPKESYANFVKAFRNELTIPTTGTKQPSATAPKFKI